MTFQPLSGVCADTLNGTALIDRFRGARAFTEALCAPLEIEDFVIQSMPDVSPTKWHLAHTSWFFEAFVLTPRCAGYTPFNPHFTVLFNSYYNAIGEQYCRARRGYLSRPTVRDVFEYRRHVDEQVIALIARLEAEGALGTVRDILILGINHEQQHQELLLTDIKHVMLVNPMRPALHPRIDSTPSRDVPPLEWLRFDAGLQEMGYSGPQFHFDNEGPRHTVFVQPFEIGSRLVTNAEFLRFIEDGGYQRPELWLSLGWATVQERSVSKHDWERFDKPLHWFKSDDTWMQYTLSGARVLDPHEPVVHVSYYEADAYARWADCRLPSEAEWECAAAQATGEEGTFSDSLAFHPRPLSPNAQRGHLHQMFGDVWEWTRSAYCAYPGYAPWTGAAGEYNGKFMANQFVLRGGSCATPRDHIRATYRNFFPADSRWQFMGIRLARDAR